MRQRFEERTKRFLDAKQRTIGVDKAYLHKQVEEKNIEISKQKEDSKKDGEISSFFQNDTPKLFFVHQVTFFLIRVEIIFYSL